MRYYKQVMGSLERMDIGLNKLYQLVKNGRQKEALKYMEEDLK